VSTLVSYRQELESQIRERVNHYLETIPSLKWLLEESLAHGYRLLLYGGALRDIVLYNGVVHDLDLRVLTPTQGEFKLFQKRYDEYCRELKKQQNKAVFLDLSFVEHPDDLFYFADCSINSLVYDMCQKEFYAPDSIMASFQTKELFLNTPFPSNSNCFFRVFVAAERHGFDITPEALEHIDTYKRMIWTLSPRRLFFAWRDFLSFLSIPANAKSMDLIVQVGLMETFLPDLFPLKQVPSSIVPERSMFEDNVAMMKAIGDVFAELDHATQEELIKRRYYTVTLSDGTIRDFHFTVLSLIRLSALFFNVLSAYYALMPNASEVLLAEQKKQDSLQRLFQNVISRHAMEGELRPIFTTVGRLTQWVTDLGLKLSNSSTGSQAVLEDLNQLTSIPQERRHLLMVLIAYTDIFLKDRSDSSELRAELVSHLKLI
jgi:hypothetical protein